MAFISSISPQRQQFPNQSPSEIKLLRSFFQNIAKLREDSIEVYNNLFKELFTKKYSVSWLF